MTTTDKLFIEIDRVCPQCEMQNVYLLNKMLVCEQCGWYFLSKTDNEIKYRKRKARRKLKPMSEFMLNNMNPELKKSLIEARDILQADIDKMTDSLKQINILLGNYNPPKLRPFMATNLERRKGGVKQVLKALEILGRGSIKEVTNKVIELYPVDDEINLLSKVATYLKRLHADGAVNYILGDDGYKSKIYSINAVKQTTINK